MDAGDLFVWFIIGCIGIAAIPIILGIIAFVVSLVIAFIVPIAIVFGFFALVSIVGS